MTQPNIQYQKEMIPVVKYQVDLNLLTVNNIKHRAGQRCFELLALIGSPQLDAGRQDVAVLIIL